MPFDIARIRGGIPALGDGWIHLDGATGMLVPEQVASAVGTAMRSPISGPGGTFPAAQRADRIVGSARRAIADLVGADPAGVVLGPSASVLFMRLADVLSESWMMGDEVVVSRLDEHANQSPWLRAAKRIGGVVQWAEIDIETCELPPWQYESLLAEHTKVVAVTAASGTVGTRTDVAAITKHAHDGGALAVVDASYATPFVPLDLESSGADVLVVSGLAWGGPAVGAMAFAEPSMLDRLPSIALDPGARGPQRLEVGPHPYPALAGLTASVDFLAGLDDAATVDRRQRIVTSIGSAQRHTTELVTRITSELRRMSHIMLIGDATHRVPALAFTVEGHQVADVVTHLADRRICAVADRGAGGALSALGVGEVGGAVRIGLAHYTDHYEVSQLLRALAELR